MFSNLHFLYWTKDVRQEEQRKLFHALLQFRTVVLKCQLLSQAAFHQRRQMNEIRRYNYSVFCIKHEHIACLYIITMNMARLGGQKIMKWLEIRLNKMLGLLPSQILLTFQTFGVTNSVQFLCDKWYDGLQ